MQVQNLDLLTVAPGAPLRGEIGPQAAFALPGDKSLSHRAALFAALATGESKIENFQVSGVTRAMLNALDALGIPWELSGTCLRVDGPGLPVLRQAWRGRQPAYFNCGNSATTLRLLTGALAAAGVPSILDGSDGLRRRPMGRIIDPLLQMGVAIESEANCAPLRLAEQDFPLRAIDYSLPVASAQVKSCLLLAALSAADVSYIREPGPSRDHTERMLRSMGVDIRQVGPGLTAIHPLGAGQLSPLNLSLPGDISAAAFLIVAALIVPGSAITLRAVGLNPTRTGLLDALLAMGARIRIEPQGEQAGEPVGDLYIEASQLTGGQVSGDLVVRMIDEFPAFAVAAACARGDTHVSQAQELRYKESDRISALCAELRQLGVSVGETEDGFSVRGGACSGGSVNPHGDHRLAMALALVGLVAATPVQVQQSTIIHESYPAFASTLRHLGAEIQSSQDLSLAS